MLLNRSCPAIIMNKMLMKDDDNGENKELTVVELFAGIGGFRIGFNRAGGFKTVYSNDFDAWCKKTFDALLRRRKLGLTRYSKSGRFRNT